MEAFFVLYKLIGRHDKSIKQLKLQPALNAR